MVYLQQFEFYASKDSEQAMVEPIGFEQDALPVNDLEEAAEAANDWLAKRIDDVLIQQMEPRPIELGAAAAHGGIVFSLVVKRSLKSIPAVSASEAATILGVSRSRVAQLCATGALESWREGSHRLVSVRSLESRLEINNG